MHNATFKIVSNKKSDKKRVLHHAKKIVRHNRHQDTLPVKLTKHTNEKLYVLCMFLNCKPSAFNRTPFHTLHI